MAGRKRNEATVDANQVPAERPTPTYAEKKQAVYDEIARLVSKWNEAAEAGEYKTTHELEKDISNETKKYTELAWDECVSELRESEDPMKEAALRLTFNTIKVKPEEQEDGLPMMTIHGADKPIDSLALHKAIKGGIGANKKWHYMVEKLNMLLTCRRALELGINTDEINNSYAMSEQSSKMDMFLTSHNSFDKNAADDLLKQDIQKVINAMIGEGYSVGNESIAYLLMIYQKKNNRKSLSVSCANHKYMRQYMLEICHECLSDEGFDIQFKKKK